MPSPFSSLFETRDAGPIGSSHNLWTYLSRGFSSAAGQDVTETTAMQIAAVQTCVRLISRVISTLPCDVFERVDERTRKVATTHPVRRVIAKPNGWQTTSEFLAMLVAHILLRGNAYALIQRQTINGTPQIVELLPLHPDQVTVELVETHGLAIYTWTSKNGRQYTARPDDILHLRGLVTDGYMGRSVIGDSRETMGLSIAADRSAATFWSGGGLPKVVLKHPKVLSEKAKRGLEDHFEATYGDASGKRRVAVMEEGMELKEISVTSRQSQHLETRQHGRSEIFGMFGVPPDLVGDTEKTTSWGTGVEQRFIGWITTGLAPLVVSIEQRFGRALLTNPERFYIKLFINGLARGDMQARGQWYRLMREIGAFSVNEVRALEDMNPVEDGDTRLQPMNLAPLGWVPPDNPAPPRKP